MPALSSQGMEIFHLNILERNRTLPAKEWASSKGQSSQHCLCSTWFPVPDPASWPRPSDHREMGLAAGVQAPWAGFRKHKLSSWSIWSIPERDHDSKYQRMLNKSRPHRFTVLETDWWDRTMSLKCLEVSATYHLAEAFFHRGGFKSSSLLPIAQHLPRVIISILSPYSLCLSLNFIFNRVSWNPG